MFIPHAGAQLYTVEFGNSPRTILAHGGWAGSWELWTEPFTILSKTWRTVAYDHRGTGATIAPAASISQEALVGDLFAVLDALGIERCVLTGESAGAAVVLRAALEQPPRFTGLVLVDGLVHQTVPDGPDPFVRGLQTDFEATIGRFADACVPETEPDCAAIRRWGRQILSRSPAALAIRLYESMYGVDLRPEVAQITQPTLILHGETDTIVPVSDAEWLASHIPNSRLQIIPGAGHVPTMTRPREVADAVNNFFSWAMHIS